ncbi:MAG TPA: IclR family transcriptional regulator [Smithellaceae bacterium]|nr:IclR family transcriptional regulator [Smithellaceae bacterium]
MAILQSVQTALRVLETVATHQPIGVSDVGRHLKINKMTAQRCLQTLCACGWIKREGDAPQTRWQITSKAFSIGRHVAENGNLRETALPVMKKLWEKIGESIHLVIAEGERAVLLERLETPQPVRLFLPMGGSAPLHAVASGKAILAFYDEPFLKRYIAAGLERLTKQTIGDADLLRKQLAQIRLRKWATAVDELAYGASAAASPIFDVKGHVVASLTISCPTSRFPKSVRGKYVALLVEAAAEISRHLGRHDRSL